MNLFTDCLGISSLKALQFLLQARVLTYDGPGVGGRGRGGWVVVVVVWRQDCGGEIASPGDEMDTS